VRRGCIGDDDLPGPGQGAGSGSHLGHHALADGAVGNERLELVRAEGGDAPAVAAQHPVRVRQQDQPLRAKPAGQASGHIVSIDVAHDPHLIECQRCHDRHPAIDEQRVDERSANIDHGRHQALVRRPFGDQQAAIDPGQPDRIGTASAQGGHERRIDRAAQHRSDDLDRRLVGDAQAILEAGRHAHPCQPLG
jgi:hypothetical protein